MSTDASNPQTERQLPPAQATPPPPLPAAPAPRRSPGVAVVLSLLPGLGHVYLGLYARGAKFFAAMFLLPWFLGELGAEPVAVFTGIFVYFFTMIDAYRCAEAISSSPQAGVLELPEAKVSGATRAGLGFGIFLIVVGAVLLYSRFFYLDLYFLRQWWPAAIVIFGFYLVGRHFYDQSKRREAEAKAAAEEWESSIQP